MGELWEECLREKQLWREDYEMRREELEVDWERVGTNRSDWRRINKTDKERFLDEFKFEFAGWTLRLEQGVANTPDRLGLTVWDSVFFLLAALVVKRF